MAIIGLILATVLVIYAIMESGNLLAFYDFASVLIVLGGLAGSMIANYSLAQLGRALKSFPKIITYKPPNRSEILDQIIELAYASKKEGLLALEKYTEDMKDPFFKKAILLIVDGTSPENVRTTLEGDINLKELQETQVQDVYNQASKLAPAFGMIGTLIGLINMLGKLEDMDSLGTNMAVALITTFYGAFLANAIFIPVSGKLQTISDNEVEIKTMVLEGILAIQSGESPYLIKERLSSYIIKSRKDSKEDAEERA